jgi:methylthioribose-1-phosphate isomerase
MRKSSVDTYEPQGQKNFFSQSLIYERGELRILDQQLLPQEEKWVVCESVDHMISIIQQLKVRGAPLIGVAAAFALLQEWHRRSDWSMSECIQDIKRLRQARPTAVNLMNGMDRLLASQTREDMIEEIYRLADEDVLLCERMASKGAAYICDGDGIMTYCNTGALATVGVGTAFGVLKKAYEQKKSFHVYACETRPLLQGGRLTAWELKKNGIPHTLICDNMAADLMKQGKIQKIFVGADRIAVNGDTANKIGTYMLAVLAFHHKIPFYVVAPYTTLDLNCSHGRDIEIEQRSEDEVRGVKGAFGKVQWTYDGVPVYNPAFDVTPRALITDYVLDRDVPITFTL